MCLCKKITIKLCMYQITKTARKSSIPTYVRFFSSFVFCPHNFFTHISYLIIWILPHLPGLTESHDQFIGKLQYSIIWKYIDPNFYSSWDCATLSTDYNIYAIACQAVNLEYVKKVSKHIIKNSSHFIIIMFSRIMNHYVRKQFCLPMNLLLIFQ